MFESTVVCGRIALGIQGEHHARKVSFAETAIWKERFGEGTFELLHQRNGDNAPYPVVMTIEDGVPYWYVTNSDTAVAGVGKCELRYIVNHVVIKSCTFITDVAPSLGDASEEIPEPQKAWVDQVLTAAQKVEDAVVHCPIIGENGNWLVWDGEKGEYIDTGVKCSGDVPTKLSELTNDIGYITVEDIPEVEVPTKLSELEADSISGPVLSIGASALTISGGSIYISKTDYGFSVDGNRIQLVGDPEDSTDATNKGYVDGLVGNVETALDSIISIQNSLIGGDA